MLFINQPYLSAMAIRYTDKPVTVLMGLYFILAKTLVIPFVEWLKLDKSVSMSMVEDCFNWLVGLGRLAICVNGVLVEYYMIPYSVLRSALCCSQSSYLENRLCLTFPTHRNRW